MKKFSNMRIVILMVIFKISSCQNIVFDCSDDTKLDNFLKELNANSSLLFSQHAAVSMQENVRQNLQNEATTNDRTLLLDDVLPPKEISYLKRRPPSVCGHPVKVTNHVTVLSLYNINEASMTYSLDIYLTMAWIDHRLRYPNITSRDYLLLDPSWLGRDLWQPDIVFQNAREVIFHERIVPNHFLWMLPNKGLIYCAKSVPTIVKLLCKRRTCIRDRSILYQTDSLLNLPTVTYEIVHRLTLILTCRMDFSYYPHDTQECDLKMESMTYSTQELAFDWDHDKPLSLSTKDKKILTPQFQSVLHKTENCTIPYTTGSYTCIRAIFFLRRRIGHHLIHTYFPSGLTVVLSWVPFWIKPRDITARVGLGVTSLLTLATLNTQSQASLPPVSYGKAIDLWMISCVLFVFCSVVEFAIINYLLSEFPKDENEIELQNIKTFGDKMKNFFTGRRIHVISHNIDRYSRAFFPLCFVTLNVWYWSKYSQSNVIDGIRVLPEN